MGNVCGCDRFGIGLLQKEEAPPTPAPALHKKKDVTTTPARPVNSTYAAVTPDNIRKLALEGEVVIGGGLSADGNDLGLRRRGPSKLTQHEEQPSGHAGLGPELDGQEGNFGGRLRDGHVEESGTGEWGRLPPRGRGAGAGWGADAHEEEGWGSAGRVAGLDVNSLGVGSDAGWGQASGGGRPLSPSEGSGVGQNPEAAGGSGGSPRSDGGEWGVRSDGGEWGVQQPAAGGGRGASPRLGPSAPEPAPAPALAPRATRKEQGPRAEPLAEPAARKLDAAASGRGAPAPESPARPARRRGQGPVTLRVPSEEHLTIGAALAAAVSGDTVLVAEGTYYESLSIAAVDVDVCGQGAREACVVEARGRPVLSFRAARGSVRNLTLRQAGGVCECAVEIAGGELALEDCVIESEGDAAVLVRGAGARPHIARNVIREAAGVGVHVTGWAAPVLEDNEISGCRLDGLVVSDGGNPRVQRNRITGCRTAGILVRAGGEGVLEENEVRGNAIAGVLVASRGAPTLRGNVVCDGGGKGIEFSDGALGRLDNNSDFTSCAAAIGLRAGRCADAGGGARAGRAQEVRGNMMDGVVVRGGADPVVAGNRVTANRGNGVYVFEDGLGTFEENDVGENESSGVVIRSGGNPTLRRNKVHHSKKNGIYVYMGGRGVLEDNEVFENRSDGISVKSNGDPVVSNNVIRDGRGKGVFVHDKGRGLFEGNDIASNGSTGVTIATGADPILRRNKIAGNSGHGVCVDKAQGLLEGNAVEGNSGDGMHVRNGSTPEVRDNEVWGAEGHGIHVCREAAGVFEGNQVHANRKDGITVRSNAAPTLRNNAVYGNGGQPLNICDGGGGIAEDNQLA